MPRILLVDDEHEVLSRLRRAIHAMPEDTFTCQTIVEIYQAPDQALARARHTHFDLVIADWRMPAMSGVAFLTALVALQPGIARLVLSGHGDFLSEAEAIHRIGVFHFISKPWHDEHLRLQMRGAMDHRRSLDRRLSDTEQPRHQTLGTAPPLQPIHLRFDPILGFELFG